jgi:hypothetical protein
VQQLVLEMEHARIQIHATAIQDMVDKNVTNSYAIALLKQIIMFVLVMVIVQLLIHVTVRMVILELIVRILEHAMELVLFIHLFAVDMVFALLKMFVFAQVDMVVIIVNNLNASVY